MLEFHDVVMLQGLMYFYLCYKLNYRMVTFCLALERFSELLAMILAAEIRLV